MTDSIPLFLKLCFENPFIFNFLFSSDPTRLLDDRRYYFPNGEHRYISNFYLNDYDYFDSIYFNYLNLDFTESLSVHFKTKSNKYFSNYTKYFGSVTIYGLIDEVLKDKRIVHPYKFIFADNTNSYHMKLFEQKDGTFSISLTRYLNQNLIKITFDEYNLYSSKLKK